jgi:hypothetical protein
MSTDVEGRRPSAMVGARAVRRRERASALRRRFCPTAPDVNGLPAIARLFRRLTYLWAGINLALSATSLVLLLTVPVGVFVGTTAASTWVITGCGVVVTVFASSHVARREGLATAVGPDGSLHAYLDADFVGRSQSAAPGPDIS